MESLQPVTERLAEFLVRHRSGGVPENARHEAKRLLLNGLRSSIIGVNEPTFEKFGMWVESYAPCTRKAHTVWRRSETTTDLAAFLGGAAWFLPLLDECHIPTGTHPMGTAAAAALAEGEYLGAGGASVLDAIVLGTELHLALAGCMMPELRVRGFAPLIPSSPGAAAAAAVLGDLTVHQTANALGLAMVTSVGLWEMAGTMAAYYAFGEGARSGVVAAQLAGLGVNCAPTIFEGRAGMLHAYSGVSMERAGETLGELGKRWRILELSCQRYSGDTVTQPLLECVFELRKRDAGGRPKPVSRLTFGVDEVTAHAADYRRQKFGRPRTSMEANSDPRYCVAAAWTTGRFTAAEREEPHLSNPEVLALRDRIEFDVREEPGSRNFQRASLDVMYTDGSSESVKINAFKGDWRNPFSDEEVAAIFVETASAWISRAQAEEIVDAVWQLDTADDLRDFARLVVI